VGCLQAAPSLSWVMGSVVFGSMAEQAKGQAHDEAGERVRRLRLREEGGGRL